MITYYTEVDPRGYVSRSMFTNNPEEYAPIEGYRLLPDTPPSPPEYTVGESYPVRIEPVPLDATQIPYEIRQNPVIPPAKEPDVILEEVTL